MENKLTVKQKYQLHKGFEGKPRVVIYANGTEQSWDVVEADELLVGSVAEGLMTLGEYIKSTKDQFRELHRQIDAIMRENKELHETIKLLLQVKE